MYYQTRRVRVLPGDASPVCTSRLPDADGPFNGLATAASVKVFLFDRSAIPHWRELQSEARVDESWERPLECSACDRDDRGRC